MSWLAILGIVVAVVAVAAIFGIKPDDTRPVTHTRLMNAARIALVVFALLLLAAAFLGCAAGAAPAAGAAASAGAGEEAGDRPEWAIAIHGGAGVISKEMDEAVVRDYHASLERALALGRDRLARGDSALDTVEAVVALLEDDPKFNAGKGAVYTHDGRHELDAAIMDGRDRSAGAVAGLTTVRHPIHLARAVMERTPHVFLIGAGAEAFADEVGVERVENSWFDTEHRREALERALEAERAAAEAKEADDGGGGGGGPSYYGTVGAVALDRRGDLAAATSTGGLTAKRFGRVGDVPVVGAGTWADNPTCAVSGTGKGEQFIRHTVASRISALVAYRGLTLEAATREVIERVLSPGDGGVIAVGADGSLVLAFNTPGMFRGAADSSGRFGVAIWEDE